MAENHRTRLKSGALFDLMRKRVADSAEACVSELVLADLAVLHLHTTGELCSLGRDHDAEIASARMTLPDQFGNLVDVERNLRNQNHVGATRHAAVDRDPAGIT